MADDADTARRELDERLERAFDGATPAQITAAIDALIAAVREERDDALITDVITKARHDVITLKIALSEIASCATDAHTTNLALSTLDALDSE